MKAAWGLKPRVLLVAPYPPKQDGIAVYTQHLVGALEPYAELEIATHVRPAGVESEPKVHRLLSSNPWSIYRLTRLLRQSNPDIVHIQFAIPTWGFQGLYIFMAVAFARSALHGVVVTTLHEVKRELDLLGLLARILFWFVSRLSIIVVHSKESLELLRRIVRVPTNRLVYMPHGVFDGHSPEQAEYGDRSDKLVLYFGYLHPDKGIEYFVDAAHLIQGRIGRGTAIHFVIAGGVRPRAGIYRLFQRRDERYERELRRRAAEAGTENVEFLGYVPDKQLDELLGRAQVTVFPYLNVTQSGAVNRAIARRSPIVASDLVGLRDNLGDAAVLVPPADAARLAEAILEVVENDETAAALASAVGQVCEELSGDRIARQLLGVYHRFGTQ